MGILWEDRVTNREVLDRAGTASVKTMLQKSQLHWAGHGIHMKTFIFQNRLFMDNYAQGRSTRADLKFYKDNLKTHLCWADIKPKELMVNSDPEGSLQLWGQPYAAPSGS